MELNEARKNLEACLPEELKREYFAVLKRSCLFSSPISKEEFDSTVRKFLVTKDQIRCHNYFLMAMLSKAISHNTPKSVKNTNEKGVFESVDFSEYLRPSSPSMTLPTDFEMQSAAAELFIPDSRFISNRIALMAWENGLEGADNNVTDLIIHACQVFIKNIITAMISRKKGYKIRDRKFQYGFNLSVPDPFIRNYNNIIDDTQESKVEVDNNASSFKPKCKISLEKAEQQVAFSYSCAKKRKCDNILTVKLLYDTVRENPKIVGLHSIQSLNLYKLSLGFDDDSL